MRNKYKYNYIYNICLKWNKQIAWATGGDPITVGSYEISALSHFIFVANRLNIISARVGAADRVSKLLLFREEEMLKRELKIVISEANIKYSSRQII